MLLQVLVTQVNRQAAASGAMARKHALWPSQHRTWMTQWLGISVPPCCCVRPQFCHHAVWPGWDVATKTLTFSDRFSSFKTSIHPYESKLLWKYFRCKTIPECVLFTDSCMNVRLVLLWLFCLRWHGCTFPSYYSVKTVCLKKIQN